MIRLRGIDKKNIVVHIMWIKSELGKNLYKEKSVISANQGTRRIYMYIVNYLLILIIMVTDKKTSINKLS